MLNKYGEVINHASLENYNTYGIKSSAKYLVKPNDIDKLLDLINYLNKNNIKYYVLGKGSNVILPDDEFNGVIISLELLNKVVINDNTIDAQCGVTLASLGMLAINNSLSGFEYLVGIPGTLGGALYGNAGVKDHTIYDYLESVLVIRNGEYVRLQKKDIKIDYRHTEFKENNDILVSAIFKLDSGNTNEMKEIVNESRIKRINSQPLEYKNAGSVFKNPQGDYAGRLIENLGLKGYKIGGAEVSEKHANFIVNTGNATSEDIKKLIMYIKSKVKDEYDIELELEQIIVSW